MKSITKNPVEFVRTIERLVPYLNIVAYFTRGFAVMFLWGMLAQELGIPTLGYLYAVGLVYLVDVFKTQEPSSIRFKRSLNAVFDYEENINQFEEQEEKYNQVLEALRESRN